MATVYPGSVKDVVEIDPIVSQVVYEELGLPRETSIRTYNQDARLFLIQREDGAKYNIVIGDAFNGRPTPYHLTTLEFDRLVKASMESDGIYLLNVIDNYGYGRYMASFTRTLKQTFRYVYLLATDENFEEAGLATFVIIATDRYIDLADYTEFVTENGNRESVGIPFDEVELEKYLAQRDPILLTDDYAPTDILLAPVLSRARVHG